MTSKTIHLFDKFQKQV